MFSLMAPTFTLYDDFNFPAIASRCDDAPSTRGPGDSRFSAGLRETLAGDRSRIRRALEPAAHGNQRGQPDHAVSNQIANGASRHGGFDFVRGGCLRMDVKRDWSAEHSLGSNRR